jgi:ABC-2 type transport system permease protein
MFAAIGIIGGLLSEKFDHNAAVTNFVVTPLSFLSGTFSSTDMPPEPLASISHWSAVFHLIDGFPFGFIGAVGGEIVTHAWWTPLVAVVLCGWASALVRRGCRLKAWLERALPCSDGALLASGQS